MRRSPWLLLALLLLAGRAAAVEYNFAGSASLNYKLLVNELSNPRDQRNLVLSGFNVNASLKAVVDVSPYLSATVKICYGCHGLEAAYLTGELTPHPAFNVRAGRFMPSFGDFYLRHDPSSHKTADNPLPYDMGHMIHGGEWGYGVFPVPYVDNGAEVYGTVRAAEWFSMYYAFHVVNGWKGGDSSSTCVPNDVGPRAPGCTPARDFALRRMRFVTSSDYIVDNNRFPSFGGRLALTFARTASMSAAVPDITIGGSAMYGAYDDYDQLHYLIVGADLYVHLWRINLRAEVLRRQMEMDPRLLDYSDTLTTGLKMIPAALDQAAQMTKDGFYVEADFPLGNYLEGVLRADGLRRSGPRPAQKNPDDNSSGPATAALNFDDWILRYTVGLNVIPVTGSKIKLSYEHWSFKSIPDDTFRAKRNFNDEYEIHVAIVTSF